MMRDERWKESWSPEAEKITAIQTSTGSQYLMIGLMLRTAHESKGPHAEATPNVWVAERPSAKP
jgi:hypothetical protein